MKKFFLDVILLALFVAEMSFHHLPKILHEILGVVLAVAIVLHVAINFRRFKALFKKISPRKIFIAATDFLPAIFSTIIFFTGAVMSNYLFVDFVSFELRRNMTIHQLHVAVPYMMMILLGVHVGLHAQELRQRFSGSKNFFNAVILFLAAIGAFGLFFNRVPDRILMKHIFATPATDLHGIIFAAMIFGGIIFFALITFLLDKKIFRR